MIKCNNFGMRSSFAYSPLRELEWNGTIKPSFDAAGLALDREHSSARFIDGRKRLCCTSFTPKSASERWCNVLTLCFFLLPRVALICLDKQVQKCI